MNVFVEKNDDLSSVITLKSMLFQNMYHEILLSIRKRPFLKTPLNVQVIFFNFQIQSLIPNWIIFNGAPNSKDHI